jgi:hypothetical protein
MKRSFLIKQLKSLKNQVESLLEVEGEASVPGLSEGVTAFASAVGSTVKKSTLGKYFSEVPEGITLKSGATTIYNVASAPDGAASLGDAISYDWAIFKMGVTEAVKKLDEDLDAASATYKSLKGYLNRISNGLESTYNQIQAGQPDFWKNAASWQKFSILLAMFALLCLVIYAVTTDLGGTAKKIYDTFINAVKNASSRVADAASKIEASVEGIKAAANVFIKAFVAPFEVLFETLRASASEDVAIVFGVFTVSLGAALAILYYRGRPQEAKKS